MAGSRLEKIGTIFSRTTGLLRSGAIKYQDRPVWYDIYRVFPPKLEPHIDRESPVSVEQVPNILYKEDKVRALFFKKFGLNPDPKPRRLGDPSYEDPCTAFVAKYNEVQTNHPHWDGEQVFGAVAEEYASTRPQFQKHSQPQPRSEGQQGQGQTQTDGRTFGADLEDEDSVSAEVLRRGPQKMTLVTKESLRALFEEAKSNQGESGGQAGGDSKVKGQGGKGEDK